MAGRILHCVPEISCKIKKIKKRKKKKRRRRKKLCLSTAETADEDGCVDQIEDLSQDSLSFSRPIHIYLSNKGTQEEEEEERRRRRRRRRKKEEGRSQ
jgi:hypothetical protein